MKQILQLSLVLIFMSLNGFSQEKLNKGSQNTGTREDPQGVLPEITVDPGEVFVIPIQVNDIEALSQLRIRVTYDQNILNQLSAYATGGVLDNAGSTHLNFENPQ